MEETGIRYVGIDLAKRTLVVRIEDSSEPKAITFQEKTNKQGIGRLMAKLRKTDRVAMEACSFAFHLAEELIQKVGCETYVLNAGQLAIIYRSTKKTDLEDAAKLAWLLQRLPVDELPIVTLPTAKEKRQRALMSELSFKKRQRTRLLNRYHSLFVREGITDVDKKAMSTQENREIARVKLVGYTLREAMRIDEELEMLEKHLEELKQMVCLELKEEPLAKNLLSIPGVGPAVALAFIAHVGDGSRFKHGRQVSNFVGMTPRIDNSGETVRLGHITKKGCLAIRSLIVQAAWAAVRSQVKTNTFQRKYLDLAERRGKGRAIVAVARRMLEMMWLIAVRNETYNLTSEKELRAKLLKLGLIDSKRRRRLVEPAA
jgi:transposase